MNWQMRVSEFLILPGFEASISLSKPIILVLSTQKKIFTENIYAVIRDLIIGSDTLEERLRQAIHNIFELSRSMAIDMEWHIRMKMDYNNLREYKHGNKKY